MPDAPLRLAGLRALAGTAAGWLHYTHYLRCLSALCMCLGLLLAPLAGVAGTTEITQLRVERADDGIFLSAVVQFELPAVVEDALRKGIAVYFVVEADIHRDRWYWTDPRVASAARTLRLAYQPLTDRWRVNVVSGLISSSSGLRATLGQTYDSLPEALVSIQRLARWKIADPSDVEPEATHSIDLSFRLDLSQLPRPFQIGVAGQRSWTIAAQVRDRLRLQPAGVSAPAPGLLVAPANPAASATPITPAASAAEGSK